VPYALPPDKGFSLWKSTKKNYAFTLKY